METLALRNKNIRELETGFGAKCAELIDSGGCKADCCGHFPMQRGLIERNKGAIQVPYKDLMDGSDQAFPFADDRHCIFLDRQKWLCTIYSNRPWLCRKFGDASHPTLTCPRLTPEGKLRTRAERRRIRKVQAQLWDRVLSEATEVQNAIDT